MKTTASKYFTRQGCVAGFTASGDTVTGRWMSRSKCWVVGVVTRGLTDCVLSDPRTQRFPSGALADAHADALIDWATTSRLKWW